MREKRKAKRILPKTVLRLPDRGIGCIHLTVKSGRFGGRNTRMDRKSLAIIALEQRLDKLKVSS
jgi:hypothetical protein